MRLRLRVILPVTIVALVAACSSEPPVSVLSPTASEVLARVEAALGEQTQLDPDEVVVPEGCRLVIELDEYDFETEVVVCDEPPATSTTTTNATETTTAPPVTEAPAPPELSEWVGSENARSIARQLRRTLIEQSGCETSQDLNALENLTALAPTEVQDLLFAAIQDLRRNATLCNVDVAGWRASLEDALDHLAEITAVLEDASG